MINLAIAPKLNTTSPYQKKGTAPQSFRLQSGNDTFSFSGRMNSAEVDMSYKNVLNKPLVSEESPTYSKDLKKLKLHHFPLAKMRVASLSRYLKEDMVGFVVPKYTLNGEQKGGYQWFEKGAEYLLKGTKENVYEHDYKPAAKEFYGLLSTHDKYWKSQEFIDYLSTLKQTPAIQSTISAVSDLKDSSKDIPFKGTVKIQMFGYFSPLKAMDKLLNDGCAYTGEPLIFDDPKKRHGKISAKQCASMEHIMPKSWGGPCDDANYMLTSAASNSKRGNMGLIDYLKGASA